jgi:hypothetical protein
MIRSRLRTLILTLVYPNRASYYDDWRDAFVNHPQFDCVVRNIIGLKPADLAREIEDFDAIIMLHACNSDTLEYFAPLAATLGLRNRAKLATFVGNEFNSPYMPAVRRTALFAQARCDIVATQLLQEAGDYLYAASGARIVSMAHALNTDAFRPGPAQRPIDIGVKGYRYPPYLGDNDRNRLLHFFADKADVWALRCDISEDKRLDRDAWAKFLQSCHGTITTETGSWYVSPDDQLINRIHAYLDSKRTGPTIRNTSRARSLARLLPSSMKAAIWQILKHGPVKFEVLDDYNTSFEELEPLFFTNTPRAPVYGKAISSRHFDAIGTQTCQIALRGRFNDILTPGEHYLAIAEDFANVDEIVSQFKHPRERSRVTEAALDHVLAQHTYRHRADTMLALLGQ